MRKLLVYFNTNGLELHFLLRTLLDYSNFWNTLFSKIMLNFWLHVNHCIHNICTTISLKDFDFGPKISLILGHCQRNSITKLTLNGQAEVILVVSTSPIIDFVLAYKELFLDKLKPFSPVATRFKHQLSTPQSCVFFKNANNWRN